MSTQAPQRTRDGGPPRPRRPLVRLATRLTARPRVLGGAALLVLAAIVGVVGLSVNGVPFQHRHQLSVDLPPGTPAVKVGDQVRVGGQRAGIVRDATPLRDRGRLTVELTPRFWPLGQSTRARVRVKAGSGLTYVELLPAGPGALPDHATIPLGRTSVGTTLPMVAEAFDATTRAALGRTSEVAGAAVLGRGPALNRALGQLPGILEDGLPVLDGLTPRPGALAGLIDGSARLAGGLAGDGGELAGAVRDGVAVLRATARGRDGAAAALTAAPALEHRLTALGPALDAALADADRLLARLGPAARDTRAALPALARLFGDGAATRRAVAQLTPGVRRALGALPAALVALREPVRMLQPLTAALGTVGDTLAASKADMLAGVRGLAAVTSQTYAEGTTAPGAAALRFTPVFTCHPRRNPFPKPGTAAQDRAPKDAC